MHIHTVFFWLKEGLEPSERERFLTEVKKLGTIDLVKSCHVASPVASEREVVDDSFDYSLHMVFDNTADQDAYQVHADHDVFIDECKDLWTKVVVYDSSPV